MSQLNPTELDPADWGPLGEAWTQFVEENPHLGFSTSRFSSARFARRFHDRLASQGVMVRTIHGRYLCHREKFAPAAFTVLLADQGASDVAGGRLSPPTTARRRAQPLIVARQGRVPSIIKEA